MLPQVIHFRLYERHREDDGIGEWPTWHLLPCGGLTIAIDRENGRVGGAACSMLDQFVRRVGAVKARGRLLAQNAVRLPTGLPGKEGMPAKDIAQLWLNRQKDPMWDRHIQKYAKQRERALYLLPPTVGGKHPALREKSPIVDRTSVREWHWTTR